MSTAYCYAEGDIEFGHRVPKAAISIMKGREGMIKKIISDECVDGTFSGIKKPFIKAVNDASKIENPDQDAQCIALAEWLDKVAEKYYDTGVFFSHIKF